MNITRFPISINNLTFYNQLDSYYVCIFSASYAIIALATTAAVSVLSILAPKVSTLHPFDSSNSISSGVIPPSGPTITPILSTFDKSSEAK